MKKIKTTIEINEDAYLTLSSLGYSKGRIAEEARRYLSAHLFKERLLSLGKAAELAEMNISDFIEFLDKIQIPIIDYDDEELEREFEVVKEIL